MKNREVVYFVNQPSIFQIALWNKALLIGSLTGLLVGMQNPI
jgi:hypothetical protein